MRLISVAITLLMLTGCSQHLKIAADSGNKALANDRDIVKDLETMAIQDAVNLGAAKLDSAVEAFAQIPGLERQYQIATTPDERDAIMVKINKAKAQMASVTDENNGVIPTLATKIDKITFLSRTQHERTQELFRVTMRFVWEQQNPFTVIVQDFADANERAKVKEAQAVLKATGN